MMPITDDFHPVKWLDDHGWTKYNLVLDSGEVCAAGAIRCMDVTGVNRHTDVEEIDAVRASLIDITGYKKKHDFAIVLAEVNDHPDTTLQNVRDALVKVFGDYA